MRRLRATTGRHSARADIIRCRATMARRSARGHCSRRSGAQIGIQPRLQSLIFDAAFGSLRVQMRLCWVVGVGRLWMDVGRSSLAVFAEAAHCPRISRSVDPGYPDEMQDAGRQTAQRKAA